QMQVWTSRRDALAAYARRGAEQARQAGAGVRSLNNSLKRLVGQQEGLNNPRLMAKKEAEEKALRDAVAGNAQWRQSYGDAWDQVANAYRELPPVAKRIAFTTIEPSRL